MNGPYDLVAVVTFLEKLHVDISLLLYNIMYYKSYNTYISLKTKPWKILINCLNLWGPIDGHGEEKFNT